MKRCASMSAAPPPGGIHPLSLSHSAASFWTITFSQKVATALYAVSPLSIADTTAGRERPRPTLPVRVERSDSHAGS
ncbi:unnamed protein product, partial [Iphiclides podalirius]